MIFFFFFFFFLGGGGVGLPAQRSVMSMIIIPLPHYGNFGETKLKSGNKCYGCQGSGLAQQYLASHFPLPKQTPWRRPCVIIFLPRLRCGHLISVREIGSSYTGKLLQLHKKIKKRKTAAVCMKTISNQPCMQK